MNEEVDRLERAKKKLYTNVFSQKKHGFEGLHEKKKPDTQSSWSPDVVEDKNKNFMPKVKHHHVKKFFLFSVGFFVLAILVAGISIFRGSINVSDKNIEINIFGNAFAEGGETLPIQVEIKNKNSLPLELADLVISYPKGAGVGGEEIVRERISLGEVPSRDTITEESEVLLFGEEGSIKTIKATLEYRVKNSSAIFVKEATFDVTLRSAPILVSVTGPETMASNQEITLVVDISSNSEEVIEDLSVKATYPFGFIFKSSDVTPTVGNNVWSLGDIPPGVTKKIEVKGTLSGEDGDDRVFRFETGIEEPGDPSTLAITLTSYLHSVSLVKPFFASTIEINGEMGESVAVPASDSSEVEITWVNNLPTRIIGAEITATISGSAYDKNAIDTNSGFFRSADNTIVWDSTNYVKFQSVEPGETGTLSFNLTPLPQYSSGVGLITNPEVVISISMKGTKSSSDGISESVSNATVSRAKVDSNLSITGELSYNEGPFDNTGPIPPKVDSETTYTVTWTIANSSNIIGGAIAEATLPSYVSWKGAISPGSEEVSFDELSRTIKWNLGDIQKGVGYTSGHRSVSFKIGLIPSSSQVGEAPIILNKTTLYGKDKFTGSSLTSTRNALNTSLYTDTGVPETSGRVVN